MKQQNRKKSIVLDAVGGVLAVIAVISAAALLTLIGFLLYPEDTPENEYIFDRNDGISLRDVEKAGRLLPDHKDAAGTASACGIDQARHDGTPEQDNDFNPEKLLSEPLMKPRISLRYFRHLKHRLRNSSTMGEHLEKARQHLQSLLPAKDAEKLYNTYENYLQCEMQLQNEFRNFADAQNPKEAIELLGRIQEFRRAQLGQQLADRLFGTEVKEKEYSFRRAGIISDQSLYGKEKEKRIRELNEQMWGESRPKVKDREDAYKRYREKLKIYRKDLAEMESAEARQEKIREFRQQVFDEQTAEALQSVDRQIAEDRRREETYREKKKQIEQNPDLSESEKKQRIDDLRADTFKDEADAAKRREAIRNAGNERMEND